MAGKTGTQDHSPPPTTPTTVKDDGGPGNGVAVARWLIPIGIGGAIALLPTPDGVEPQGWYLLAIFVATIIGIIARPAPMGVIALLGLTVAAATEVLTLGDALSGFSNSTIWLIVIAFLIARAVIKTGLGTRIAYLFVRRLGRKTIGLAYGLAATDLMIAPATPSNTARGGGVIFPIVRSLSASYGSEPDDGPERIGSFLTQCAFQINAVTSAMFATAMAANPLIIELATQGGVTISWGQWALAASVPGLMSLALIPQLVYRLNKPAITETPGATDYAREQLARLGPMSIAEKTTLGVFVLLIGLWTLGDAFLGMSATLAAMIGLSVFLVSKVLTWEDVKNEGSAWDTLVWFAVLVTMASFLNQYGVVGWFSGQVDGLIGGWGWFPALTVLLLVYFYVHYFFASLTAHVSALYPTFLLAAIATGAPPMLAALALGMSSNLMGGITQYSTGPAPVYFGAGYTSLGKWWGVGFAASLLNLAVFGIVGTLWMRLIGIW